MHINKINSLEDLAIQLHEILAEVSENLLPTGYCSTYHRCDTCPFGKVMYTQHGIDIRMCESLLNLEFRLGKIVGKINQST